jgi:hypothetical protein
MSYPPQPGYGAPGGYPPPGGYAPPVAKQSNGMAIAALVCGILTIVTCLFPLGLVAAILGFIGLSKAKNLNGSGRGLAIGGIITGIIGLISGAVLVFAVFLAADAVNDIDFRCGGDNETSSGLPCESQGSDDPTPDDGNGINSDPVDQVCNVDRFLYDPDCT